jgi:hypothetical protein
MCFERDTLLRIRLHSAWSAPTTCSGQGSEHAQNILAPREVASAAFMSARATGFTDSSADKRRMAATKLICQST